MDVRPSVVLGLGETAGHILDALTAAFELYPPEVSAVTEFVAVDRSEPDLVIRLKQIRAGLLDQRKLDAISRLEGYTVSVPVYLQRNTCDIYLVADLSEPSSEDLRALAATAFEAFSKPVVLVALVPDAHLPGIDAGQVITRLARLEELACGDAVAKVFLASRELEEGGLLSPSDLQAVTVELLNLLICSTVRGDEALRAYLEPIPPVRVEDPASDHPSAGTGRMVSLNYAAFGARIFAFPVAELRKTFMAKLAHRYIEEHLPKGRAGGSSAAAESSAQRDALSSPEVTAMAAPFDASFPTLSRCLAARQAVLESRPLLADKDPATWHNDIASWDSGLGVWYVGGLRSDLERVSSSQAESYQRHLEEYVNREVLASPASPGRLATALGALEERLRLQARDAARAATSAAGGVAPGVDQRLRKELLRLGTAVPRALPLYTSVAVAALAAASIVPLLWTWVRALIEAPVSAETLRMVLQQRPPSLGLGLLVFLIVAIFGGITQTIEFLVASSRMKATAQRYFEHVQEKYAQAGNALLYQTMSSLAKKAAEAVHSQRLAVERLLQGFEAAAAALGGNAVSPDFQLEQGSTLTYCLNEQDLTRFAGRLLEDYRGVADPFDLLKGSWRSATADDLAARALAAAGAETRTLVHKAFEGYLLGEGVDKAIEWARAHQGRAQACLRLPRIASLVGTSPAESAFWAAASPASLEQLGLIDEPFTQVSTGDPYRVALATLRQRFSLDELPIVRELLEALPPSTQATPADEPNESLADVEDQAPDEEAEEEAPAGAAGKVSDDPEDGDNPEDGDDPEDTEAPDGSEEGGSEE